MTNEEAKEKLYMEWQKFLEDNIDYAGISEAYKMAFKALDQEPCEDAISRQAVLDLLEDTNNGWIINEVSQLPSVNPQEPKTGQWIDRDVYDADRWKCSECGRTEPYKENYCPNCGARMVEPQESEEV